MWNYLIEISIIQEITGVYIFFCSPPNNMSLWGEWLGGNKYPKPKQIKGKFKEKEEKGGKGEKGKGKEEKRK